MTMAVFDHIGLCPALTRQLDDFLGREDFPSLYKSYDWKPKKCSDTHTSHNWKQDTYDDGFPNIHRLESQLRTHIKSYSITHKDIFDVACWGDLPNLKNVNIKDENSLTWLAFALSGACKINSHEGETSLDLEEKPEDAAILIQNATDGIGPTHIGKVLRFAVPEQYGAIDTKLVRVFGKGDKDSAKHDWITLRAYKPKEGRWSIQQPPRWSDRYGVWINILRYFVQSLNREQAKCPHPKNFVKAKLRTKGLWTCADVEMALFAYADSVIHTDESNLKQGANPWPPPKDAERLALGEPVSLTPSTSVPWTA